MEVFAVFSTCPLGGGGCLEALLHLGAKHEVRWMMSWPVWEMGTCSAPHLLAVSSFTSGVKFSNLQQKQLQAWHCTFCIMKYDTLRSGL